MGRRGLGVSAEMGGGGVAGNGIKGEGYITFIKESVVIQFCFLFSQMNKGMGRGGLGVRTEVGEGELARNGGQGEGAYYICKGE